MRHAVLRRALRAAVALVGLGLAAAAGAQPPTGRYDARLCVRLGDAPPSCGPAQAQLQQGNRLRVSISDIVYQLKLHSSQADVVLMHGAMQIDEFVAACEWSGSTLAFVDADKRTRYELTLRSAVR
jgi:hypothetical protein